MPRRPLLPGRHRIAAIALALLALAGIPGPARAQESADAETLRLVALRLVNKSRAEAKLPPLAIGKEINVAAKYHAADMLARNFYDHTSPEGKSVGDRYQKAGGSRWKITAENIARCTGCDVSVKTVEDLQKGWMNSKAHRENILRKGISQFGFSIVGAPGKPVYAVQTFTGPGVSNAIAGSEIAKPIAEADVAKKALEILNKERKQAGKPAFQESASLTKAARSMLPQKKLDDFSLAQSGKVMDALPPAERQDWQSLSILAAACGGCGAEPTDADIRAFVQQWLGNPGNKTMVMNPATTYLGFALAVSGEGKKVGLAVLGRKHPPQ